VDDRGKSAQAHRTARAPVIDGHLDDEAWRLATPDRRFTQNFPDEGKPPTQATDLYLLYDDRALYVGLRCHDSDAGRIVERLTRRDRENESDRVQIDIDSRRDGSSAYHFELNAAGVLVDGVRSGDTDYSGDWDGLWSGAASRDAGGWTAEIEIPWRTLRFGGRDPEMGLEVRRLIQRRGEIDAWAFIPREAKAEVSRYGRLVGLTGLGPKRLFQIAPYIALRLTAISGSGAQDGLDAVPTAGGDLKLGLSSSLTLDATINPDFGQVEADQVVLNLTTFEIFYPEKRPFFLEGADLFNPPESLFYSRRVGHAPPAVALGSGEDVKTQPIAGRIWGAAKLSGQIVPHLSVAAIEALTAEQSAEVTTPGAPAPQQRLLDPLANYAVLRVRSDFGQSYVGALATAVDRFESRTGADATTPCSNDLTPRGDYIMPAGGRCTHDGYAGGIDGKLITSDGTWGAVAQVVASRVVHGPTRLVADGTQIADGDSGWGVNVNAGKQGGEHVLFAVGYTGHSPKLDFNDAGYLRAANVHNVFGGFWLRSTKPLGLTLESNVGVWTFHRLSWGGVRLWDEVGLEAWARFKSFWTVYANVIWHFQHYDNRETRDGAITERPAGWDSYLDLRTDPRRRLFALLSASGSAVQHGLSLSGTLTVSLRPLPQVELDVIPRGSWTFGEPRWAWQTDATPDGSQRYWFGDLDSRSFDVTLRGTYTFTPRLTLQLYAQLFVAGYRYSRFVTASGSGDRPTLALAAFQPAQPLGFDNDGREGAINVNLVLRWEYLPGSTLIGVYTRSQAQTTYGVAEGPGRIAFGPFRGGPATDVVLVKLSYLWN
jgi:hypothetical protein